jgi:hypothetical protein
MSHVSKIELVINDLTVLKKACSRLNLQFCENQKTYRWYGKWIGGQIPDGLIPGQSDHAIRVPDASYEIGVIRQNDNTYTLHADMFSAGGLETAIGQNAGLLKQAYAVCRVQNEARHKHMRYQESTTDNGIRLTLTM